jgi:D-alanine-D-alanine ligase
MEIQQPDQRPGAGCWCVGLTYDLRADYLAAGYGEEETAEFDRPDTIDGIADALSQLGHTVDRIGHVKHLVQRLAAGDRWDLVFNICEGLHGPARESQVPAILDVFQIPYTFSDPLVTSVCLDKRMTKLIVRDAGVPTPRFLLVQSLEDLAGLSLEFPLFAKPVAEGTGKGITAASKILNREQLRVRCQELLARFCQPVLVEEFLSGREFTVGLLGTGGESRVMGTLEIVLLAKAEAEVYSYTNKEFSEELCEYHLRNAAEDPVVREAEAVALAAWKALGCRDGGRVDLRCDRQGRPQFMEVNPLAGLHPQHSDLPMLATALGMPYVELIGRIVASAGTRVPRTSGRSIPCAS